MRGPWLTRVRGLVPPVRPPRHGPSTATRLFDSPTSPRTPLTAAVVPCAGLKIGSPVEESPRVSESLWTASGVQTGRPPAVRPCRTPQERHRDQRPHPT